MGENGHGDHVVSRRASDMVGQFHRVVPVAAAVGEFIGAGEENVQRLEPIGIQMMRIGGELRDDLILEVSASPTTIEAFEDDLPGFPDLVGAGTVAGRQELPEPIFYLHLVRQPGGVGHLLIDDLVLADAFRRVAQTDLPSASRPLERLEGKAHQSRRVAEHAVVAAEVVNIALDPLLAVEGLVVFPAFVALGPEVDDDHLVVGNVRQKRFCGFVRPEVAAVAEEPALHEPDGVFQAFVQRLIALPAVFFEVLVLVPCYGHRQLVEAIHQEIFLWAVEVRILSHHVDGDGFEFI